jgi:hypothetical protein
VRVMRTMILNESGASLALVGLTMFALFGMAMLAIDVGGIVVARRQMVRAADAAALAAAQSCATSDADGAEAKADEFAVANHQSATGGIVAVTGACGGSGSGSVTVRYEVPQELFFAPALGFHTETAVPGRATALWAPSNEAFSLPLEITLGSSENGFPCIDFTDPGGVCSYYFDNSADHDLQDSSNWGWINLGTWPESEEENAQRAANPGSVHCPNAGSEMKDWLDAWIADDGGDKFKGELYPSGTYVCVNDGGSLAGVYGGLLEQLEGKDVFFPVNDPNQMYRGHPGLYSIVGFAPMHIEEVLRGKEATGSSAASGVPCPELAIEFAGSGDTYSAAAHVTECSVANGADSIAGPELTYADDDETEKPVKDRDYSYDPTSGVITWLRRGNYKDEDRDGKVDINAVFTWSRDAVASPCGIHDLDPNAVCMIATWLGPRLGGGDPLFGARDFGLRSIRLSRTEN